jgi:hypothetical protein
MPDGVWQVNEHHAPVTLVEGGGHGLPAGASPSGGVIVAFVCGGTVIFMSSLKWVAVTVDSCLIHPACHTLAV